jgi:hypothetical protein
MEERSAHKVFVEKPEVKRSLGRPWCKIFTKYGTEDLINLATEWKKWRALVNVEINFLIS